MILNDASIELAFKGFKSVYTDAYNSTPIFQGKFAMKIASSARDETYGWPRMYWRQFPQMREWPGGDRVLKDMEAHAVTITNRKFESPVNIRREDFADDRLGVFKPVFSEMGHTARQHPDEMIFELLATGFSPLCYDGQS